MASLACFRYASAPTFFKYVDCLREAFLCFVLFPLGLMQDTQIEAAGAQDALAPYLSCNLNQLIEVVFRLLAGEMASS